MINLDDYQQAMDREGRRTDWLRLVLWVLASVFCLLASALSAWLAGDSFHAEAWGLFAWFSVCTVANIYFLIKSFRYTEVTYLDVAP